MEDQAVVLYSAPAIGHLVPMVELGKLLLAHRPSLSIHVLLPSQAYEGGSVSPYIAAVSAAHPSISFHHLPPTSLPPDYSTTSPHLETLALELLCLNNPNVHQALVSISQTHRVRALVIDFFCANALSVARGLGIPCYYFFSSAGGGLAMFLHLPVLHETTTKNLKDLDTAVHFPGVPPLLPTDIAELVLDRSDRAYELLLESATNMQMASGIIVNTLEKLEEEALKTIKDGKCVPDERTPPIYCIGPLVACGDGGKVGGGEPPECLTWLDSQPGGSVVFLSFGSLGVFSAEQLKEIAIGLERSSHRFLWVVRNPATGKGHKAIPKGDPDLDALLPEGFLERTAGRGLVLKGWAPQVAVLNHGAVGGFVTHCGWNSVLEAVCAGVPMIAWPLYAEQRQNRVFMVEAMRVALPMEEAEDGSVSAAEVERRVRGLMESEGETIRERMQYLKKEAKGALSPGGSAQVALAELIESWNTA
ncbi:Glycosyltransferase [Psidium guajava]|nr:Glycosyltransferase [Psidium guajava]